MPGNRLRCLWQRYVCDVSLEWCLMLRVTWCVSLSMGSGVSLLKESLVLLHHGPDQA